jgi:hypothetical protein
MVITNRGIEMGNWTTVHISGTCNKEDLPALKEAVNTGDDWSKFHCLCNTGGLCGLGDWANESISALGNLAERDYGVEDIAEQLEKLVKEAPSLKVKIHVGGDYESLKCAATVICEDGKVSIDEPEIKELPSIPQGQIQANLLKAMGLI